MARNKAMTKNKINEYIKTLEKHITVSKVVLYGSWANGSPDEYSDIDLAVFSPDFGKHKLKELQLLSKLTWNIDESIEAIPYSTDQLNNSDPTNLANNIMKNGEIIYDKTSRH
ncbi:nucleotidyltransferase domain-containing protein [Iocasia frigidifontis]|uniref:Nucleotidyltransferase domain-containing protein n=1 Tax=Iocasia fonsfrigidae TaxID=2682810 RepID=A0A8A7KFX9_9FIRM|nr:MULTISPECIES: nucleotidyltransferase domain-containing protein [Halanaerobiaceae]AZO94881.1 nucleotidyltransferase domain-containing protein [Halocella sp. SP3-1]QTL97797.1 nucleotidyltransferase domain-containing protein [Iocasia fonsfrigidae]